jgi:hypothetical protein
MNARGDVLTWLEKVIGDREDVARAAEAISPSPWTAGQGESAAVTHMSANDPESVLRRCAADRKLIYEVRRTAENAKSNPWDRVHGYGPYADAMMAAVKVVAEGYGWTESER